MQSLAKEHARSQQSRGYDAPPLSDREFNAFRELIHCETGISLSSSKRDLLRSRLRKRLVEHELSTFKEYYDLVRHRDAHGTELIELINSVTTNKTDFFRESHHFSFLSERAFPELVELAKASGNKRLRIWSAACSTGEEPYSIAATAKEFFAHRGWNIRILASDIDSGCLEKAQRAVYRDDRVEQIPLEQKKRIFLKGFGQNAGTVCVRPELRQLITFRRINFADDSWPIRTKFDLIFCRNALIYFDREFQDRLLRRFLRYLNPHGYLILGHSENVTWMDELQSIGQTIYRPKSATAAPPAGQSSWGKRATEKSPQSELKKPEPEKPAAKKSTQATTLAARSQAAPLRKPQPVPSEKRAIVAGEVFASDKHMEISTLLGSCIAACLYDPNVRAGGMNHFLLPEGSGDHADTACYGINAMELLINELMTLGAQRDHMVAKLYGGARVMGDQLQSSRVGAKNAEFVRKYLTTEGIPIVEQKVGGTHALRIVMVADDGDVKATELESSHSKELLHKDKKVLHQANTDSQTPDSDQITFF